MTLDLMDYKNILNITQFARSRHLFGNKSFNNFIYLTSKTEAVTVVYKRQISWREFGYCVVNQNAQLAQVYQPPEEKHVCLDHTDIFCFDTGNTAAAKLASNSVILSNRQLSKTHRCCTNDCCETHYIFVRCDFSLSLQ